MNDPIYIRRTKVNLLSLVCTTCFTIGVVSGHYASNVSAAFLLICFIVYWLMVRVALTTIVSDI